MRLMSIILMSWGRFHTEFHRQVRKASYNRLKHLSKTVSETRRTRYPGSHGRTVELVERGFSDDEFMRFIQCVHDADANYAFSLMAILGLRVGELLALRGDSLEGDCLRIKASKGSYSAYVKLPAEVVGGLSVRCHGSAPMFPMLRKTLQQRFALARAEAGLDDVYMITKPCGPKMVRCRRYRLSIHSHSLRHYAIQKFYRITNNPDLTRAFARHRDMKSTQVYMKKDQREFMELALRQMVPNIPTLEVLA